MVMRFPKKQPPAPSTYAAKVIAHYRQVWDSQPSLKHWEQGPIQELPTDFRVLEFAPRKRRVWTYATCGMSQPGDESPLELHLFSPQPATEHVELLTAVAHYHRTASRLGLGHTVNFGRAWLESSGCDHGLLSLPYLDGPSLEFMALDPGVVRFLWLIPITPAELAFIKKEGVEALEQRFEKSAFNYLDPHRAAVV